MDTPSSKIKLPELSLSLNSLEPIISEEAFYNHYHVHHAGYVNGFNEALSRRDYESMIFNYGGYVMHNFLWDSLRPANEYQTPGRKLQQKIYQY